MKNKMKFLALFLIGALAFTSCNKDDDEVSDGFIENINESYFSNFEIGNKDLIVSQSNVDMHIEFDYVGKSKVSEIYLDIASKDIKPAEGNKIDYKLTDYLIPKERYAGQLNVHIHYHVYYDENDKHNPAFIPSEGTYLFKVTVVHEDNSTSIITKEFQVLNKFKNVELGTNGNVDFGATELHTDFEYDSNGKTVADIKYVFWFKEWRDGQNVEAGKWDKRIIQVPNEIYKDVINPDVHYDMELPEGLPVEQYWLNIEVTETGNEEAIVTSLPFYVK